MRIVAIAGTIIRRSIIVIFGLLLIIQAIGLVESNSSDKEFIKSLNHDGPVTKYTLNKKIDMDGDIFTAKELYITSKKTVLHYSISKQDPGGWSFPNSAIKLINSNGEELMQHSSSSSSTGRGETGFISFNEMNEPLGSITLKYDWYDRQAELNIPLAKDGEGQ
ncbi:hypothetical protein J2T12_002516 [Paenibacillus anaericanus]|uniref:hypothetical protein n=1 Tax=Paenibacillus anaericanus TaxID=170367 RepID=UPI0027875B96|nr:hypothetical protein [Paenibacillus anaericanus]MDQ0089106.1 hypothetical protein [Paenibacillus anaericanus]